MLYKSKIYGETLFFHNMQLEQFHKHPAVQLHWELGEFASIAVRGLK